MSPTSQSDNVFIVGDLNINLLDPTAIENDFLNNCHSNSLIPLINKPTGNANNYPSISDQIRSNQLYDAFNGIFLLDITDHYPIFTIILPINYPQKWIRVKFRDHSRQNMARLKLEVERYVNNHVQINQDVSSNTNNFCNDLYSLSIAIVVLSRKRNIICKTSQAVDLWRYYDFYEPQARIISTV